MEDHDSICEGKYVKKKPNIRNNVIGKAKKGQWKKTGKIILLSSIRKLYHIFPWVIHWTISDRDWILFKNSVKAKHTKSPSFEKILFFFFFLLSWSLKCGSTVKTNQSIKTWLPPGTKLSSKANYKVQL